MRYQAEMLAQVLRLAQVKVQELVQVVPEQSPQLEVQVQLLQQEVQAVLRQAVALQQVLALQQEEQLQALARQAFPQLGWALPPQAQQELEEWGQAAQRALVEAEAQVEVLAAGQVRELVEVPLLEASEEQKE